MATAVPSTAATTTAAASATSAAAARHRRVHRDSATISATIAAAEDDLAAVQPAERAFAIEVRLIRIIRKISAALNHQRTRRNRLALTSTAATLQPGRLAAAHLRALLFQNRLAR